MIEHMLPSDGGLSLIREAYRVLVPGGVLRVATPDISRYMCGYVRPQPLSRDVQYFLQGHANRFEPMERIEGRGRIRPSDAAIVNNIFRNYGHKWIYDLQEVEALGRAAGIVSSQHICRSNREARGLPVPLQRALRRATKPANDSLACWLDQSVREDESLYVHLYKAANWPNNNDSSWRRTRRPFCKPVKDWFPCVIRDATMQAQPVQGWSWGR